MFLENDVYYETVGENIAICSSFDIEKIANGWAASDSHLENIIDERYTKGGMSVVEIDGRYYCVQLFAS